MAGERPSLTPEQVALAESRVGIQHPVISLIDRHLPTITLLNDGYAPITNNQEQQRYVRERYGFFADDLVALGHYTMGPEDIIAIWSRAREIFPGYHRYSLAGMISSAYAIQGVDNQEWRKFPRHYLEEGELPEDLAKDKTGLLYVKGRLYEIYESLSEIDFYVYGTKEHAMELAFNLAKKESQGDLSAKRELEALIAHQKAYQTPVLGEIHENFGNGMSPLFFYLRKALDASAL